MTARISTRVFNTEPDIKHIQCDLGFIGLPLDDRGNSSSSIIQSYCKEVVLIEHTFQGEVQQFKIDGEEIKSHMRRIRELLTNLRERSEILVESTTLGLPEIASICLAIKQLPHKKFRLHLLYVEPFEYKRKDNESRKFDLSSERKFSNIIGFNLDTTQISQGTVIAFLGFEQERLAHFTEQFPSDSWEGIAYFGVPAFKAGWESDSYYANTPILSSRNLTIEWEISFCAANSVSAAYKELEGIAKARDLYEYPFLILPLGTKPHGIASVIFCCEYSHGQSGITYDHPVKVTNRSENIGKVHFYSVEFS